MKNSLNFSKIMFKLSFVCSYCLGCIFKFSVQYHEGMKAEMLKSMGERDAEILLLSVEQNNERKYDTRRLETSSNFTTKERFEILQQLLRYFTDTHA